MGGEEIAAYRLFPRQHEVAPSLRAGPYVLNWFMRLGKTRACLHAFDQLWQSGGPSIMVVVCPSIAKGVWSHEQQDMGLQLPMIKLDGVTKRRATGERIRGLPLMVIVNWEIVDAHLTDLVELASKNRIVLVLDETQDHCTNPANKRYKAVKALALLADRVWICTGTLYRTSAMDYYWQLRLLGPSAFPWYYTKIVDFAARFVPVQRRNQYSNRMEYRGIKNLDDMLDPMRPWLDRRLEELEELPDDFVWWLDEGEAYRYAGGDSPGAMSAARAELSELKAMRTVELIKRNRLDQEPLVVFGWHKRFVHRVAAELGGMAIDGDISADKKDVIIADFNSGKTPVLVVNIKSGGVAIDLARARNAVFGEVDWIATSMEQAEARIRGPKQRQKVAYWYVLCSDSVDEFVWRTMLRRAGDSRRIDEHLLSA